MRSLLLLTTALIALLSGWNASAQVLTQRTPSVQTDGDVYALTQSRGRLFLGGNFGHVGFRTGNSASLVLASSFAGTPDLPWPVVEGDVRAAAPDNEGGWYIGGSFTSVAGVPRNGLARIRADKTLDPDWNPGVIGTAVNALVVRGDLVIVGGNFTGIAGQGRTNLAAVNASTGQLNAWNPVINGEVRALALHRDSLYIGGTFTTVNGSPRSRLAGINLTSTQVLDHPNLPLDEAVNALAVDSRRGMIFAGGEFAIPAPIRLRLVQIDLAGQIQPLDVTFNSTVHALHLVTGGQCPLIGADQAFLLVGGAFTTASGAGRTRVAAIEPYAVGGPRLTDWGANIDGVVRAISSLGCEVYIGGDFTRVNSTDRNRAAALSLAGGSLNPGWDPNADGSVRVLSRVGNRLFAGGSFSSIGRKARRNLASVNLSTLVVEDWRVDPDGPVEALLASTDFLYFGGSFSRIGDQIRNNVARATISNPQLAVLDAWNPNPNGPVYALALGIGNRIFIGGEFSRCGARDLLNLANVDASAGQAAAGWQPNPDGPVYALALNGSSLYVGGNFTLVQGTQSIFRNMVKVSASTGLPDINWVANTDNPVRALAVSASNNRLYIGGEFFNVQRIDGTQEQLAYAAVVTLNDAFLITNWRPTIDRPVRAIAVSPATPHVFLGGDFQLAPGGRVASVDTTNGANGAFNGLMNDGSVRALLYHERSLYVGGSFTSINSRPHRGLVEFTNCTARLSIEADRNALCPGDVANLKAIASGFGFFTYNWAPVTGLLLSNQGREATAAPSTTTTYTLTVTDGENCRAVEYYTVTVNAAPSPRAIPVSPICPGSEARLSAEGGVRFVWSSLPGPNVISREAEPLVRPEVSTTYSVLVTDAAGCSAPATVAVQVLPAPNVRSAFVNPMRACISGDREQLEVIGAREYVWEPATGLNDPNIGNPTFQNPTNVSFTVTGTDANGCTNTTRVQVLVGAPPVVTVSADRNRVCSGQTVTLTASTTSDSTDFYWDLPSGGIIFGPELVDVPFETTTYTVTGFNGYCFVESTLTVEVIPNPEVDAGPGPEFGLCPGDLYQLRGVAQAGAQIEWKPAASLTEVNILDPIAAPNQTTLYTLIARDLATGCADSSSVLVLVRNPISVRAFADQTTVCTGTPVVLNAVGSPGVIEYRWFAPGIPGPISTSRNEVVLPNGTTSFTVEASDGVCTTSDAVLVTVNPTPNPRPTSTGSLTICQGDSTTLLAQDGEFFTWAPSESLSNASVANPIAKPTQTTTYTVTARSEAGCSSSATVTVFVLLSPVANAGPDTTVCRGLSTMLMATGGVEYSWTPTEFILGPTNIANPVVRTEADVTTFVVVVRGQNGCTGTDSVRVTLRELPIVDAGPDIAGKCPFANIQLNVEPEGLRYLWSPPFNLSSDTIRNPICNTEISRRYTVQVTDVFGCIGQDDIIIEVDTVIQVDAGADVAVCFGDSVALQAEVTGINPRWEPTAGLSDYLSRNPRVSPLRTTMYYYFVQGDNGCEGRDSVLVEVYELPVPATGRDTLICPGGTAQLFASGGVAYDWSPSESLIDEQTISSPRAAPTQTTRYQVTVTDSNGCSAIGFQQVNVFVPPVIEMLPPEGDTVFCGEAGSVRLAIQARPNATYQWLRNDTPIPGAEASAYTAMEQGVYRVRVNIGLCPVLSRVINITVFPRPNADAGSTRQVCIGAAGVRLEATGGVRYSWMPSTGLDNPNIPNPLANPARTTIYTVTVTDTNNCTATDTVRVIANRIRSITASAYGPTTICEGSDVELTSTRGPGFSYQWKRNGTVIPNANFFNYRANQSGTYTVDVSLPGCPPVKSNQVQVEVLPQPLAQVTGGDRSICFGATTQLQASGGTSYRWAPTRGLNDPFSSSPSARPDQTTTYTVTAFNAAGCSSTAAITVTVTDFSTLPRPQIIPARTVAICPGTPVELRARNNAQGFEVSYQWRRNNVNIPGATGSTYTTTEPGLYTVSVSSPTCGPSSSEPTRIDIRPVPIVTNVIKNVTCAACTDGEIFISAVGGLPPYRYSIDGRNFYAARVFTNLPRGEYTVFVRDSAGCVVTADLRIEVEPNSRKGKLDESDVSLYPNPSRGLFTLSIKNPPLQPFEVAVHDLLGKQILNQRVMPAGSLFDYEVDLSEKSSGVYFLTLTLSDGRKLTRKLIKE